MQKIPFEQSNNDDSGDDILNLIQGKADSAGNTGNGLQDELSDANLTKILHDYFVKRGVETSRPARTIKALFNLLTEEEKLNLKDLGDIEFELQSVLSFVQKIKQKRLS